MKGTLGWDCKPTILLPDGFILPRKAEDLLHGKYYPNGSGTWPVDPITKQKMEAQMKPEKTALPWYLKDKHGYPIEFVQGKGRVLRIICQNIRKITG